MFSWAFCLICSRLLEFWSLWGTEVSFISLECRHRGSLSNIIHKFIQVLFAFDIRSEVQILERAGWCGTVLMVPELTHTANSFNHPTPESADVLIPAVSSGSELELHVEGLVRLPSSVDHSNMSQRGERASFYPRGKTTVTRTSSVTWKTEVEWKQIQIHVFSRQRYKLWHFEASL